MEKTFLLICEGRCNPHIGALDREIDQVRHRTAGAPLTDSTLIDRLNRLEHTAHVATGTEFEYTCVGCGHLRRWGCSRVVGRELLSV